MIQWSLTKINSLQEVWNEYWPLLEGLSDDQLNFRLNEGRMVKEVLAHIAFWEEAAVGYVWGVILGKEIQVQDWYGGSDLGLKEDDPWPAADVHNAREASWGRNQSKDAILRRMETAHSRLINLLYSLGPGETELQIVEYFEAEDQADHFTEHLAEIRAELTV